MVCLQQERENLTNQLSANPAALKAWLESFGVIRAWSKSYLGGIEGLQGLFGDVLTSSIRSHFGITNILRLKMDVMSIKICILRDLIKQRVLMSIGIIAKY